MHYLLSILLVFVATQYHSQDNSELIGKWKSTTSINKKYSSDNCVTKETEIIITFKKNNKYEYSISGWPTDYYSSWSFNFDKSINSLTLTNGMQTPDGGKLLDIEYSVIFIDNDNLHLNNCLCIRSEMDKSVSSNCITKFKRIK
jgi:hypothetical protein